MSGGRQEGARRRTGLVGNPLKRRHSKVMHDAAFASYGIAAAYELHEVPPAGLATFVDGARSPQWLGFQVTAPYKQDVMDLLDDVDAAAQAIGAVNTVVVTDGRLVGGNTDAPGFRGAVERELDLTLSGMEVVVVGAGGAAHAVVQSCVDAGAAAVTVVNRTRARAERLASRFSARNPPPRALQADDSAVADVLGSAGLLVNASTVGMTTNACAADVGCLPDSAKVFDCVYVPATTPLVHAARGRGLPAANGVGMLVEQAAIAFGWFTGRTDAAAVMRAALEPLLHDPSARA